MKARAAIVTRFPTNEIKTESMVTVKDAAGNVLDVQGPMQSYDAFTVACDLALINRCEFIDKNAD